MTDTERAAEQQSSTGAELERPDDAGAVEASAGDANADGIPDALQRDWILLALVAAASRFVPVPLLDDVVKTQANRGAVKRALTEAGSEVNISYVSSLYDTGSIFGFLISLPLKVILYPLRKIVNVISAVHGVPTDLLETLLLGRSVYRVLKRGGFDDPGDVKAIKAEAKVVRGAFDQAFKGTNFKVVSSALGDALSSVKDLGGLVAELTAELLPTKGKVDDGAVDDADLSSVVERDKREDELDDVEEALNQAEVVKELSACDARFDEALARAAR